MRDDRGAVAIVVALSTLALFGVSALAVDAGQLYEVRRASQTTADLAALAGAAKLPDGTQACRTAVTFLLKNKPTADAFSITPDSCTATGTTDGTVKILSGNQVQVNVPARRVGFGFAGAIGFTHDYTSATAIAAARSPAGLTPFSVATTNQSGIQCIHDNSNGKAEAVRAAFIAPMAPAPTGLSPTSGPVSETTSVTISGSGFGNNTKVQFDGNVIASTLNGAKTAITFTAPASYSTPKTVKVYLKEGNTLYPTAGYDFAYAYVKPVVSSVVPSTEVAGATITVNGQHFAGTSKVTFGAATATFVYNSPTSLTVTVPAGTAGSTVDVQVTNPAGTSTATAADRFTYKAPAKPTVTNVSPNTGPDTGGTSVTVTGTGFTTPATVTFNGVNATGVVVNSSTSITAVSPAGAVGVVDVVVTTAAGTSTTSAADHFTYGKAPTVTTVVADTGPSTGGTAVTITGTGFAAGSLVYFGSAAATNIVVVNATTITASTPAGTGTVTVSATNSFGASNGGPDFTYFSDSCVSSTGDFGYLNVPRKDNSPSTLEINIISGVDHVPGIFPSGQLPAINTQCLKGSTPIPGAKLDDPPKTVVDGVNCLDIENGNKVSSAGQALLDGISNPNLAGRLQDPDKPPNATNGSVAGRPPGTEDSDSISAFIASGHTMAEFIQAEAALVAGGTPPATKFFTADIVNCPRFAFLPVLNVTGDAPNGQYPVVGFVGSFIETFNSSNKQIKSIQAWTFPLSWLPDVIGASANGTIPYLGQGPVVPLLVK